MTTVPRYTLNNGVTLPVIGLGVFQTPPAETTSAVDTGCTGNAAYRSRRNCEVSCEYTRDELTEMPLPLLRRIALVVTPSEATPM